MTLDPVVAWSLRIGLGLLFGAAALHKLSDLRRFEAVVTAYELVPRAFAGALARLFPTVEVAIAAALLAPGLRRFAALGAAALLLVYTLAISVSLARGRRDIECGCFGARTRVPLSGALVARNVLLLAASSTLFLAVDERSLVWVDGMTVSATVAALALLWASGQQLSITGPALRRIGGAR